MTDMITTAWKYSKTLNLTDECDAASVAAYRVQAVIAQYGKDAARKCVALSITLIVECSRRPSDWLLAEAYLTAIGY